MEGSSMPVFLIQIQSLAYQTVYCLYGDHLIKRDKCIDFDYLSRSVNCWNRSEGGL